MPSRLGVAAVVLFWLATTAAVAYRDVWPRLAASGPPPLVIDLADEAGQLVPVRWLLTRDGRKIGSLTTEMKYVDADDTFRFTHTYRQVDLDVAGAAVSLPELTLTTRVTRAGDLRAQGLDGRLTAAYRAGGATLFELSGRAQLRGRVVDGRLVGTVTVTGPGFGTVERPLEPVAVPAGQVLNPLLPVNKLGNVRPGARWVVPEVNPLGDAVRALVRRQASDAGVGVLEPPAEELLAEVSTDTRPLTYKGEEVACRVIEYRGKEPVARTWVRAADGKVLRQEAFAHGERVALERDD